ncbi:MAG: hypothetical protein JJU18_04520 [Oceanicaulis sp.]|nr:hypothetical protein [Oceanicaulis sp.]
MIAITALAALIVRVYALFQIASMSVGFWMMFRYQRTLLEGDYLSEADLAGTLEALADTRSFLIASAIVWVIVLILAGPACRLLAGRYRDLKLDLGLKGTDAFRLTALAAGVFILIPVLATAFKPIEYVVRVHFQGPSGWQPDTIIGAVASLVLIVISVLPDRVYRGAGSRVRGENGGDDAP